MHHQVLTHTLDNIVWPGLYPVHLNTIGTKHRIVGDSLHLSGYTL
jgi:hypothetical protein